MLGGGGGGVCDGKEQEILCDATFGREILLLFFGKRDDKGKG